MIGANIVRILVDTLNSNTTISSTQELSRLRGSKGFVIELLIISDNVNCNQPIRQAALIYLKNIVQDHCNDKATIHEDDLNSLKGSLLEALIRNATNNKLAPTIKEIIFQMAEKYYPKQWPEIVEESIKILDKGTQLDQLLGSVQALKAVFSVFGGSIVKQIELSNLCNKAILPLFGLVSKLFQNFNQDTSYILVSLFKLFNTAIQFHIPPIIQVNIHYMMIFVKKILDLKVPIGGNQNTSIYQLKKICLRILFRMYQRHANIKLTSSKQFASLFQQKYTTSFVQTLVLQVLSNGGEEKQQRHRHMELIKCSLSCLAYINRQNSEAANLLIIHRDSMVKLCLQNFTLNFNRTYQNFTDFKLYVHENRVHLKQFIFSLLKSEALLNCQEESVTALLGLFLDCIQNGNNELKQLAMYIFTEMSTQLQYLRTSLDQKMSILIVNYVKPLLKQENHFIIRARACNLIASYNYLDLPQQHLNDIAVSIYNCLLVGNSEKQAFLKIYACNAFNSILKYGSICQFIKPHLQDILKIYTSLLEADISIIKNFEDLLNLLEEEIAPFANDLVGLLINLFHVYSKHQKGQSSNAVVYNDQNDNQQDDQDQNEDEDDNNNQSIAKAIISSIRQILQAETTMVHPSIQDELFNIVVNIFGDQNQLFIEEGYNILNLLLYKSKEIIDSKYFIFFKVMIYGILGVPAEYIDSLKKGNNFNRIFGETLQNICVEPDNDLLENCIGCIRNYIVKSNPDILRNQRDAFNVTYMDYLFKMVRFVHQNQDQKRSQTDRLIILTIYITLIQYKVVSNQQLNQILKNVLQWMQMEMEIVEPDRKQFGNNHSKYTYTPIYLQIIMITVYYYGNVAQDINFNLIVGRVVDLQEHFKCDYEISRIVVGIISMLEFQYLSDTTTITALMNILPDLVCRLCKLRQEGDRPQNDLQMDDQAEQQQFFGDDQNTHMMAWQNRPNVTANDLLLKGDDDEESDNDWEEESNKFYESTLDKLDELKLLETVLKGNGNQYCSFMSIDKQQQLSVYLSNAPSKNIHG